MLFSSAPVTGSRPAPSGGTLAGRNAPALDLPARFVATGLGWLVVAAAVMPWALPWLAGGFYHPAVLALVHTFALGFLGNIIVGAAYQLVPVALGVPLRWPALGRLSWWLFTPGVIALVLGLWRGIPLLMAPGGALLFAGVMLFGVVIGGTLYGARRRDAVAWHVAAATAGLVVAAGVGALLAANKAGEITLGGAHFRLLAAHATLMIGGWVTIMIAGVATKLVPMFTLTEDLVRREVAWLELLLLAGGVTGLALAWALPALAAPLAVPAALAVAIGGALFTAQMLRLYRLRRRRAFDIHAPFTLAALGFGWAAALLLVSGAARGWVAGDRLWVVTGWLALAGWAGTMVQGHLYKITTFLTWLHRYAPLAGKMPLPRLDDLYSRRLALLGGGLWGGGVLATALVLAGGNAAALVWVAPLLSLGILAFVSNLIRIVIPRS